MDVRGALILSLLRRDVPADLAALAATAVHPFVEGRWIENRSDEKAVRLIARSLAHTIGRGSVDVERLKIATKAAFEQYAVLAPAGSAAESAWDEMAQREALQTGTIAQDDQENETNQNENRTWETICEELAASLASTRAEWTKQVVRSDPELAGAFVRKSLGGSAELAALAWQLQSVTSLLPNYIPASESRLFGTVMFDHLCTSEEVERVLEYNRTWKELGSEKARLEAVSGEICRHLAPDESERGCSVFVFYTIYIYLPLLSINSAIDTTESFGDQATTSELRAAAAEANSTQISRPSEQSDGYVIKAGGASSNQVTADSTQQSADGDGYGMKALAVVVAIAAGLIAGWFIGAILDPVIISAIGIYMPSDYPILWGLILLAIDVPIGVKVYRWIVHRQH